MRDDYERLLDIQEAITKIEKYAARGRKAFEQDELIQTWMVHNMQILGEAAANLSEELKSRYPEVPWRKITGMRNILVHGYFDIDLDIVWSVVERDLPSLRTSLDEMIRQEKK